MKQITKKLIKDVHTEHCCIWHGCKYNDDSCTVITGDAPQSFPCESCYDIGIKDLKTLKNVMTGKQKLCPHCKHILP